VRSVRIDHNNADALVAALLQGDGKPTKHHASALTMKATVMTTGPGVIIATATASTNWWSVSQ
jgi:hypothetical protein